MLNRDHPILHRDRDAKATEAELHNALRQYAYESLKPVTLGFGAALAAASIAIHYFPIEDASSLMSLICLQLGFFFLGFRLALSRWSIPLEWAHPLNAMIAASGWLVCFLAQFDVTEKTIKFHRSTVMQKMQAQSPAELRIKSTTIRHEISASSGSAPGIIFAENDLTFSAIAKTMAHIFSICLAAGKTTYNGAWTTKSAFN
jgi:hypothetical protein